MDNLLAIEPLRAIQWTSGDGAPRPYSGQWDQLYQRILDGGKSLQIPQALPDEDTLWRTLDRYAHRPFFMRFNAESLEQAQRIARRFDEYR